MILDITPVCSESEVAGGNVWGRAQALTAASAGWRGPVLEVRRCGARRRRDDVVLASSAASAEGWRTSLSCSRWSRAELPPASRRMTGKRPPRTLARFHPHVRRRRDRSRSVVLPPRAWGQHAVRVRAVYLDGFTPTCVGTTLASKYHSHGNAGSPPGAWEGRKSRDRLNEIERFNHLGWASRKPTASA